MDTRSELQKWQKHGSLVEIGGHRLFVNEYGAAEQPPLLLLHGFPTASFDYARLVPLLLPHRRLIALDFLGFGFSSKPRPHAYSLYEQAALVEKLATKRGLSNVEILAHDMGTSVALILLERARLPVTRLTLLNGSLLLKYYQPVLAQRLLLHPTIGPLLTRLGLIRRPLFAQQFSSLFPSPPSNDEIDAFWSLIAHNDGQHIYHLLIQYLNERKQDELKWLSALAAHRAPLMLLWGQRDPVSVPRIAEELAQRRPDARYVRLNELGHYPQWEDPKTIAEHLLTDI